MLNKFNYSLKLLIGLIVGVPSIAFSATEIGNSGVFFDNSIGGEVLFYSDASGTTRIGKADIDNSNGSTCDADSSAGSLLNTNSLPVILSSASYSGSNTDVYNPSSTSGHCFYELSNGEFVAIKDMLDTPVSGTVAASRIFSCQGTVSVTAIGFDLAVNCPAPTPIPPVTTAVPLSPLSKLLLALLFMGASLMMLKRKGTEV